MSFEQAIDFAAANGITQIQLFNRHLDPKAPVEENLAKKAYMQARGVTAYTIGVSGTTMNKEDNRALFELAKLFDMKLIVVEPRNQPEWDNLEELVKEYDIRLAIHNHGTGTVYGDPATVRKILSERDHRIGVCMDIGWITGARHDAAEVFKQYGDRVYDMHLKDKKVPATPEARPVDTHIGQGDTDFAALAAAIKEKNWSGVMAIETDSPEFAKDPAEFVAGAKEFFQRHFLD